MKKIITSIFIIAGCLPATATIHTVSVQNFQFVPQVIPNVVVGDTIQWNWVLGNHTTTSLSIPAGATPWDAPVTSGANMYRYVVDAPGAFTYECSIHSPTMSGSFTATAPLPVILSDFKAGFDGNQTLLRWKTSSEQNSDYFSVKRSLNGSDFSEIGRVPAAGNSNADRFYSFADKKIPSSSKYIYYLIMIADKDGKTQYTATRMIVNGSARQRLITSLTPNPVSKPGHLMLQFNADEDGSMDAMMIDVQGKTVLTTSLGAVKGINNGHIHLGEFAAGTYTMVFMLNGVKETKRIVVK